MHCGLAKLQKLYFLMPYVEVFCTESRLACTYHSIAVTLGLGITCKIAIMQHV